MSLSTSEMSFNSASGRTSRNSGSHSPNLSVHRSVRYNPISVALFRDMASTPSRSYTSPRSVLPRCLDILERKQDVLQQHLQLHRP